MNLGFSQKMKVNNLNENNIDCERVGIKQIIIEQLYFVNLPSPFTFFFNN